jgi:hypothetical protein
LNDATYHLISAMIRLFIWRGWKKSAWLQGAENLPGSGPAVFIGNHANSLGPIGCVSMIPLRLYPWMRPEMLDLRTNPEYMRVDFIEKDMRLRPPFSRWAAWGLSRLVVPLLKGVGCIPAFQSDQIMEKHATIGYSLERLYERRCLLVFPEVPDWELDPSTGMRRFSRSMLWLAVLYHRKTGDRLPFYPVCIHPAHRIRLGPAQLVGEEVATQAQKQAWIEALQDNIRGMFLNLEQSLQDRSQHPRDH